MTDPTFNEYGLPSTGHVRFRTNIGKVIFLLLLDQMIRDGYININHMTDRIRMVYIRAFGSGIEYVKSNDDFSLIKLNGMAWSSYGKHIWSIISKSSKPEITEEMFVKNVLKHSNISTKLLSEGFIHKWLTEYYRGYSGWSSIRESIIELIKSKNHDRKRNSNTVFGNEGIGVIKSIRRSNGSSSAKTELGRFGSGLKTSGRRRRKAAS